MAKHISPQELQKKLGNVQVSGGLCSYNLAYCEKLAPLINEINDLKAERNAIILAHTYVKPEIVYGVADFTGDSYGLSKDAQRAKADVIVFAAVRFMGETAKILNPGKEVLIPSEFNGCTLADSIRGEDVMKLRERYPQHTFMCYINTSAEVKAHCDVCVTSSNVYTIAEKIPNDKIFFLPDKLMGKNLQNELLRRGVHKEILFSEGSCYVHEQYDPDMIENLRLRYPGLLVVSHPECSPGIIEKSDYIGSTSTMIEYVKESPSSHFLMLTECGLTSRLQVEMPGKTFVGSCTQCRYMKSNTLEGIRDVLRSPKPQDKVEIAPELIHKARRCIDAMFHYVESPATSIAHGS